jgi:UDP-2,3-diacylglucosamine hydrolase
MLCSPLTPQWRSNGFIGIIKNLRRFHLQIFNFAPILKAILLELPPGKKIYFLSDFHLGTPSLAKSRQREQRIVTFRDEILPDTAALFLVGDLFDFWFEYKTVVPKGFVRLQGKLAQFADAGIPIHFFVGNHDMWVGNYFKEELGFTIYYEPAFFEWNGQVFHVGHGDGQGPGDHSYKLLKKIFRNPICQWAFGMIPPAWGMGLANYFSRKSRNGEHQPEEQFFGENEWLIIYSRGILQQRQVNYFLFGHRHLPTTFALGNGSTYINLGDWLHHFTYAEFDGQQTLLKSYSK